MWPMQDLAVQACIPLPKSQKVKKKKAETEKNCNDMILFVN